MNDVHIEVALRKESVDRNLFEDHVELRAEKSLSARRAWIEMDRNVLYRNVQRRSLSARRAWIEIDQP